MKNIRSPFKNVFVMKLKLAFSALVALCCAFSLTAQPSSVSSKEKIAVLNFDSKGLVLDAAQLGNLARVELDKLGLFEVLDRYDIEYLVEKESLKIDKCFGKICLIEVGRKLGADKMLTGSVEVIGETIVVTSRLIDVGTATVERSQIMEFLALKNQIQPMLSVSLQKMFGQPSDPNLVSKLTKRDDFPSEINTPDARRLNLSGPRMGVTVFTGNMASIMKLPESRGGLDAAPVMFQFGYQFETAYLNQGGLQALFEFVPIVTGLDQGRIVPSMNFLHGLRSNRTGLEFAFGPNLFLSQRAKGYFENGVWHLENEWASPDGQANPNEIVERFDSRGEHAIGTSFVFAAGKSFRSGRLNIPINGFFIPSRDGSRFGLSVGFNGRG